MTFDHLSEGRFEEFVYDLLNALGFVNLGWRRGSGKGGPSADQGRDVVAELRRRDVDGTEHIETWFVQCKHYERGVPPEALQGALAWASAERPAVVVFAVSNFISNPAKNWLEAYEQNNRPNFRIKVWERKDLERLVASQPALGLKYQLKTESEPSIHPAHLLYVIEPYSNSMRYFLAAVDSLESRIRDALFDFAFFSIIHPRFKKPVTGDESLAELMIDKVDYAAFRKRCCELVEAGLAEHFLVQAIMFNTLACAWSFANPSQVPVRLSFVSQAVGHFLERLDTESDEKTTAALRRMIAWSEELISQAPRRQEEAASRYKVLCESLIPRLALEESFPHRFYL